MTASFVQVRPIGLFPTHSPRPRDPIQVMRARRCLFGPSNPAETTRLLQEEERANLEYLQQTYQIIDTVGELYREVPSSQPYTVIGTRDSESESTTGRENQMSASLPVSSPMQIEPAQSADVASSAVQIVERLQRNPGPLKCFPIRKHPYASPSKQSRRSARNGTRTQLEPSHL